MKLYIVEGGWLYEGSEVIGVYDNEVMAKKVCDESEGYGWVDVRVVMLNEKVEG